MMSVEEGFLLVIMEVESYGVLVIGYWIVYGLEDIIEDGVNGYLVIFNDVDELIMKVC